jgi:hypothetical protein
MLSQRQTTAQALPDKRRASNLVCAKTWGGFCRVYRPAESFIYLQIVVAMQIACQLVQEADIIHQSFITTHLCSCSLRLMLATMHSFHTQHPHSFGNSFGRSRDTSLRRTSSGVTGHGQHRVRIHAAQAQQEPEALNQSRTFISNSSEGGSSSASSCGNTRSSSSAWGSRSSNSCDNAVQLGRRALLSSISLALCATKQAANAASVPSVAPAPGGSLASQLNKALPFPLFPVSPPEPIGFPRKQLDTRFAVLLMRSSYDAVDALNFIPKQQFEVGTAAGPDEADLSQQ